MTHRTHAYLRRPAARRASRGFMLIEALVALLIFSFGVLGIIGLQASMTKAQTQSKFRADASLLAQRLVGTMWTDRTTLVNYATANCAAHGRCNQWRTDVAAALPGGVARIAVAAVPDGVLTVASGALPIGSVVAANVTIEIDWTPPNEQTHTYTTLAAVTVTPP